MKTLVICVLAGCASSSSADTAKLETMDYVIPSGWTSRAIASPHGSMVEWTPQRDNERKESLVISRVANPALALERNRAYLTRDLVGANRALPDARFGTATSFLTRGGLRGQRIEGSFTPVGQVQRYQRLHAVLVDGTSLVHVLFTGRELDRDQTDDVLDGVRPGA